MVSRLGGGSLVVTASLAAISGQARGEHYAASKGGLISMMKALAVELARHGVRANAILPGWIETPMTEKAFAWNTFVEKVLPRVPMRRWGVPGDFGAIAVYLASDASSYHSGDTFIIDGALSERFLQGLLAARRQRAGRELRIVVGDPTKVFLADRGPGWFRHQGLSIEVLETIDLRAITVNPLAPQSHGFDSQRLRELIGDAVPDVPVLDVLDPSYLALAK